MREAKAQLRAALRAVAIDEHARTLASIRVADTIVNHAAFITATAIAAFVGVRNEPDTAAILRTALEHEKTLFLPRVADRTRLAWHHVHGLEDLVTTPYGLLEPAPAIPFTLELPDVPLVLVPGLAFASSGARLGHGRAYYDRALAHANDTTLIGVCLARFLDPPEGEIPHGDTDVLMHAVATEHGLTQPIR